MSDHLAYLFAAYLHSNALFSFLCFILLVVQMEMVKYSQICSYLLNDVANSKLLDANSKT